MRILGVSEGFHDAGVALVDKGEILYAGHSERYSKIKNDQLMVKPLVHVFIQLLSLQTFSNRAFHKDFSKQTF